MPFLSLITVLLTQKLATAAMNTKRGKPAVNVESSNRPALTTGVSGMCGIECCALKKIEKEYNKSCKLTNHIPSEPASNDWAPMTAEDCVFRTDSKKTSTVLDLLHDRARGLFPQLESAVNETEEEGKGGLVEKLTFSPLEAETPGAVSKVSAPSTNRKAQTTIKVSPLA